MMQKLALYHEEMLQGEFNLKELNLLFTFQVNCPGCFIHGIPLVNRLYHEWSDRIGFLGLSTAFEDFGLNTRENTRRLIESAEIVGATKSFLAAKGISTYHQPIDFPIAMDATADHGFDFETAALAMCESIPNYKYWPLFEQQDLNKRIVDYLKSLDKISLTFTLNQLKGSPTIILFNRQFEILAHHFGHVSHEEMTSELEQFLSVTN